jgi:hypothetical protein
MLIREIAEVVIGIALVALALRDVFDTVVVPGESAGALRVARRLLFMMLPVWKRLRRGKTGISTSFAPPVLMASFVAWMAILLFGFGLVAHGLGNWFSPPADSLEQAVFIAGSALATVGLSGIEAHGPARWVLVAAGNLRAGSSHDGGNVPDRSPGGHFQAGCRRAENHDDIGRTALGARTA